MIFPTFRNFTMHMHKYFECKTLLMQSRVTIFNKIIPLLVSIKKLFLKILKLSKSKTQRKNIFIKFATPLLLIMALSSENC